MNNHKTVICLLDAGSEPHQESAIRLCTRLDAVGHEVIALDILKPIPERWSKYLRSQLGQDAELALEAARREELSTALKKMNVDWRVSVLQGIPVIEVARFARDARASLVIKAKAEGNDLGTGALDRQLVRRCATAVMLVTNSEMQEAPRILAAIDPDPDGVVQENLNMDVLLSASKLAADLGGRLQIVSAWHIFAESYLRRPEVAISVDELNKLVDSERERNRLFVLDVCEAVGVTLSDSDIHLVKGPATWVVPELATTSGADLLVMGSVGRSGVSGLVIGNTAEAIIDKVRCSVLAVKPRGWTSSLRLD